jgi:glycosyltransferase involved in cell wall biosynthesis
LNLKRLRFSLAKKYRELGWVGFLRFIFTRLWQGAWLQQAFNANIVGAQRIDVLKHYDFILPKCAFARMPEINFSRLPRNNINWVIPSFGVGSGGHINIFRFVRGLEQNGYKCHISIFGATDFSSAEEARRSIVKNFEPLDAQVSLGLESLGAHWLTIATSWSTAYAVRDIYSTAHKAYFVQDFEPAFYARGAEYFFAEDTYRFGFRGITAGGWLANKLSADYGMECDSVGFSYDKERYLPTKKRDSDVKRVFFYCRPPTTRRAFELGVLVLNEVFKKNPGVEFVLAGWDVSDYSLPFPHLNCGVVSLDDLPDLYSQVDVALVISSTNLSLLPLELMACNCPVVSNSGPNVEWLLKDGVNACLVNADVNSLANALDLILNDDEYRESLIESATAFCEKTSWGQEVDRFVKIIESFS